MRDMGESEIRIHRNDLSLPANVGVSPSLREKHLPAALQESVSQANAK